MLGRNVVGDHGTMLQVLDNVRIDARDRRILGYPLRAAHFLKRLERWLTGETAGLRWSYVGADLPLDFDHPLVSVPGGAVVGLLVEESPYRGGARLPGHVTSDTENRGSMSSSKIATRRGHGGVHEHVSKRRFHELDRPVAEPAQS